MPIMLNGESERIAGARFLTLRLAMIATVASTAQAFAIINQRRQIVFKDGRIQHQVPSYLPQPCFQLKSSIFYNDFDDFDKNDDDDDKDKNDVNKDDEDGDDEEEEEEDEDDEDYSFDTIDDAAIANFRNRMSSTFDSAPSATIEPSASDTDASAAVDELLSFVTRQNQQVNDWAKPIDEIKEGAVLLANPNRFCTEFSKTPPSPSLLSKFGLTLPPPAELGPDRRADLLPVLLIVQVDATSNLVRAVLLNRRTGYLLGDLEQPSAIGGEASTPLLEKFCVQPLWFGGVENDSMGLVMLHQCSTVVGAKPLTSDGLYWGGDPAQAQEAMSDTTSTTKERVLTGFDFKFFVQSTVWKSTDLQKEIENGTWYTASVSKEVLFKSRDRMGTQRAKPLWSECMELLGGECKSARDKLYGDDNQ
ncbi:hypothetical protein MPSEU_001029700 [Mayamaea pseudoterrestris]|nr:hypothetical protein MPSEU_001029700 [Mayamaea pseudoterrestris]